MEKDNDAFRTIGEAAEELDLPQHVLRFWETRFSQIRPMKRSGGRRYYRPQDVELLASIRHLLYGEGYTIKGVQRILKQQGARTVIELVNQLRQGAVAGDVAIAVPAAPAAPDILDIETAGPESAFLESAWPHAPPRGVSHGPATLSEGMASMAVATLTQEALKQLAAVLADLEHCRQTLAAAKNA